jgi:hypothetical protein
MPHPGGYCQDGRAGGRVRRRTSAPPAGAPPSPNPKFPTAKAPRTPWLMAEWKGTNGTSEDPKSAFSDPPVRSRKNRILGGLGVMAVQSFSRIRARTGPGRFRGVKAETRARIPPGPASDSLFPAKAWPRFGPAVSAYRTSDFLTKNVAREQIFLTPRSATPGFQPQKDAMELEQQIIEVPVLSGEYCPCGC